MSEPNFTLVQLRYFAAAARHGSMTGAARELQVSQSAISSAIAALEKEVDVQLLLRHHAKGLTLTAAGEEFYRELRSFLTHGDELAEIARSAAEGLVGQLTVGCFDTLAPFRLPGLLSEFSKRHPRVEVSVIEAELAALKSALRSGACEVALTYGLDLEDEFDHVVIGRAAPYAIVSSEDPLAARRSVALAELASKPMILLDLPHSGPYFLDLVGRSGSEPDVRHRSSGFETVRSLVGAGLGFALLNQHPSTPKTYAGGTVHELEIEDDIEPLAVVLAWMAGTRLTERARQFAGLARTLAKKRQP